MLEMLRKHIKKFIWSKKIRNTFTWNFIHWIK